MSASKRAAMSRVDGLCGAATGCMIVLALSGAGAAERFVDWSNPVNVTVFGDRIEKTSGCQGCEDAGAVSRQMIRSGDGYVEFTVGETNTFWLAGLGHQDANTRYDDIEFAFRFNGAGNADVMENGAYKGGDTTYKTGDVFRVAVVRGKVQYSKNGRVLLESQKAPVYPLMLDTALGTVGASVENAVIETSPRDFRDFDDEGGFFTSEIVVSPRERWTDTGLTIAAGDIVTITAEGLVQLSPDRRDTADPAGSRTGRRSDEGALLANSPAGSLIARIGNGAPMLIGDRRVMRRVPTAGRLYLGVNDDYLADNSGEYRVVVTVE
jgi:hypothetical protein